MDNYFAVLNGINVKDKAEKKNGLTYLSWAWAWGEVKKLHPDAVYTIYENKDGLFYHTDGRTCWVKTGVTVNGIEHIEYLPVMDHRNNSIPLEKVTSFEVNKTIQRSLTKAVARHGLGLYIYAGEDLPEGEEKPKKEEAPKKAPVPSKAKPIAPPFCECCGSEIQSQVVDGKQYTANTIAARAVSKYGMALCYKCLQDYNAEAGAEQ
jgi:hypothetical protein